MKRITLLLLLFIVSFSFCDETILKIIPLSWSSPEDYIDFIERNRSDKSTYSIDNIRNMIILDEIVERAEFIESYIRKKDIASREDELIMERAPIYLKIDVKDYETLVIEKELLNGENHEFEKMHPLIYSEKDKDKENYKVEMLGIKAIFWYEKVTSQRAFVRIDIFYDYVLGWNNNKTPIIDRTTKTIDTEIFIGDKKEFKDLKFGNRIIDCHIKIGYNMLSIKK